MGEIKEDGNDGAKDALSVWGLNIQECPRHEQIKAMWYTGDDMLSVS